jgi:hypothetical protein
MEKCIFAGKKPGGDCVAAAPSPMTQKSRTHSKITGIMMAMEAE